MKNEITGRTKLTGLIGNPVAHSISPQMHNEAFQHLGLDYIYLAFPVAKGSLKAALQGLTALNITGFNVTMPFKTEILAYLDELSPQARLSGSVNTVTVHNHKLIGHTTDGMGYMRSLAEASLSMQGKRMTLFGSGGAAFAICVQAALDGVAQIDLFKRKASVPAASSHTWMATQDFCQTLERETGCRLQLYDIEDQQQLKSSLRDSCLLTNATSVGMAPQTESSLIKDPSMLHKELFVSDIIYNPRETLLLKQARAAGCTCQNGLDMLLYQGAESFYSFTGHKMPVTIIKQKIFK